MIKTKEKMRWASHAMQTDRQAGVMNGRRAGRQADRQTGRQADRQIEKLA